MNLVFINLMKIFLIRQIKLMIYNQKKENKVLSYLAKDLKENLLYYHNNNRIPISKNYKTQKNLIKLLIN